MGELINLDAWRGGMPQTLTAEQAVTLVRQLMSDGSFRWAEHVLDRMEERHITVSQVLSVLRRGDLIAGPARGAYGNWEVQFSDIAAGEKVTVCAAIDSEGIRQVVLIVVIVTAF